MKKLIKITAVFTEKGFSYEKEEFNVIKENDKAVVIDSENFDTIYKPTEERSDYKDYINVIKDDKYGLGGLVKCKGYFESEEEGVRQARNVVDTWIAEKLDYYGNLQITFDNEKV